MPRLVSYSRLGNLKLEEVPESVKDMLRLSRGALETFEATQQQLLARLKKHPRLGERVKRLESIRGVGEVTALTWELEVAAGTSPTPGAVQPHTDLPAIHRPFLAVQGTVPGRRLSSLCA